ncbi:MAG: FAD-dependent oxidoreductase [Candidatus Acidiferrales bacterium]
MKSRNAALASVAGKSFDVCVIGAGATGAGCALDSQLRGMQTVLLDGADFASGASSAATKIIHGGVRYLEQAVKRLDPAQYEVVNRALHERIHMLRNGPFLSRPMEFLIPCRGWFSVVYTGLGMKLYDWIAGKARLFPSKFLSRKETLLRMPSLAPDRFVGSIAYADGQFDDARYNLALINSFVEAGGEALNYARVIAFTKDANGKLETVAAEDQFSQQRFTLRATRFINATGPRSDTIRQLATPGVPQRMRLSKGAHLVLPLEVFPTDDALLIPKTDDGRVLFAIPWFDRLLIGTTEEEVTLQDELYLSKHDVEYLLHHINRYFAAAIRPDQIVSGFAGARPLVSAGGSRDTKKLARDHEVEIDARSGLISIMGGKWTTHRAMAEDTVNAAQKSMGRPATPGATIDHLLCGSEGYTPDYWQSLARDYGISGQTAKHLAQKFGANAEKVMQLANSETDLAAPIVPGFAPLRAEIAYCVRHEMAMTIEDALMRRTGLQIYSWRAAIRAAAPTAAILAKELGWTAEEKNAAAEEYKNKITRLIQLAGLSPAADSADVATD